MERRDVDFARWRLLRIVQRRPNKGGERWVTPLFSRLRDLWETVPENGSPYVISENRTTIRKHVDRIVFNAGLNRWERLIQNLRSSCSIDVQKRFGELAESEWIGHSPQTAKDHYLHVLDTDFEEATRDAVKSKDLVI